MSGRRPRRPRLPGGGAYPLQAAVRRAAQLLEDPEILALLRMPLHAEAEWMIVQLNGHYLVLPPRPRGGKVGLARQPHRSWPTPPAAPRRAPPQPVKGLVLAARAGCGHAEHP